MSWQSEKNFVLLSKDMPCGKSSQRRIHVAGSCFKPVILSTRPPLPGCSFTCLSRPTRFDRTCVAASAATAEFSWCRPRERS